MSTVTTSDPVTFTVVLDQYNKHITFGRDMAQRILVLQFAYVGLYANDSSLFKAIHDQAVLFFICHLFFLVFIVFLQFSTYQRARNAKTRLARFFDPTNSTMRLAELGVLSHEPRLTIGAWTAPMIIIHVVFMVLVFGPIFSGSR